ncbi:MAG TPA: asparagine synthase (glutamine-hydrolyzing) [Chloroflexota bacterium]|jgi:asparagine synthase (glutamine-hydrolysing)
MCGIAGIMSLDGIPVERDHLDLLGTQLVHRGPDDSGVFHAPAAGLAHRRLSILDLSPAGHGPMPNEDHTMWITFNGEIYNYRELIPDLVARGHQFRSMADTEVIIHAYEEYGERCVERFNGMFAFAIWDAHRGRMFCARDRCGVKPFFFVERAGRFAFASEIKALLALPWVRSEPNEARIMDFLTVALVDHTNETFFKDVQVLPAGHTLTIGPGHRTTRQYWELPRSDDPVGRRSTESERVRWEEEFEALLLDSVRLRLRSDVTVGSCLSGGIDSSTIVCMVNRLLFPDRPEAQTVRESWLHGGEPQMTFSACFEDHRIDERRFMEAVVRDTRVAAHYTYPRGEDLERQLDHIVWHQDEPFLSSSIFAQWEVMRLARAHGVKVLLDGQGADELLCGYVGYFGPFFADLLTHGRLPDLVREVDLYQRNFGDHFGTGARLAARAMRARHPWLRNPRYPRSHAVDSLPPWMAPDHVAWARSSSWIPPTLFSPEVSGFLPSVTHWLFTKASLPALLRYEDRNSMAFGVESRVPFLDYRLVEYVFRRPNAFRIEDGLSKRTLRRVARKWVPEEVWTRRDKLGFNTPEAAWLRGPAKAACERLLADPPPSLSRFVRPEAAREAFTAFANGDTSDTSLVWRFVNLARWLKVFIDQPSTVTAAGAPSASPA